MSHKKVLIVDDDEDILASTEMLLRAEGHEAIMVRDWHDVVPVAQREHPDLILQDLRMPGLSVKDQIQALRQNPDTAQVPVVLFSADTEQARLARDLGVQGFIAKPFDGEELLFLLSRARKASRSRGRDA